jgi:hypothetical protein
MRVDRVVVDRDCVVAFSCRVEDARPTALGDEVPRTVDVAVGPSFRGAHKPYCPPPSNPQPHHFPFFLSFHYAFTLTMLNRWVGTVARS